MSEAQRYRKKPVEVEAVQFEGGPLNATQVIGWIMANGGVARWHEASPAHDYLGEDALEHLSLNTLHGTFRAMVGDWIVRGPSGDFWPVKPDIFAETYEAVESSDD